MKNEAIGVHRAITKINKLVTERALSGARKIAHYGISRLYRLNLQQVPNNFHQRWRAAPGLRNSPPYFSPSLEKNFFQRIRPLHFSDPLRVFGLQNGQHTNNLLDFLEILP